MLAGLLLVRYLPVEEFALYTLAASVLTLVSMSSDLGTTASLFHFYRTSQSHGENFEDYVRAVFEVRRSILVAAAILVPVGAIYVGADQGFATAPSLIAAFWVLATAWLQIGTSVRLVLLRLAQRYSVAYRAELAGGLLRLILVGCLLAVSALSALTALAIGALAAAAVFALSHSEIARPISGDRSLARRRLIRYLLPTLPGALYFAVQGPIMIWLAVTFGGTRNIAEIGALGRLGMITGLVSGLSGAVLIPRLAALVEERAFVLRFIGYGALLATLVGAICLAAAAQPGLFLWILGANYRGLDRQLLLLLVGSSLAVLGAYVGGVNFARGWVKLQTITLAGEIAVQAVLISLLSLSTTSGVLWFQIGGASAGLIFQLGIFTVGLLRPERVAWR
jgi:O-antigen/teichoic acid export membrane protein